MLPVQLNRGSCSIIAIHGLGGHRVGSFTASNDVNWLRDLLPERISNSRILSYGYDSSNTAKYPHVQEYANNVVVKLVLLRRETEVGEFILWRRGSRLTTHRPRNDRLFGSPTVSVALSSNK